MTSPQGSQVTTCSHQPLLPPAAVGVGPEDSQDSGSRVRTLNQRVKGPPVKPGSEPPPAPAPRPPPPSRNPGCTLVYGFVFGHVAEGHPDHLPSQQLSVRPRKSQCFRPGPQGRDPRHTARTEARRRPRTCTGWGFPAGAGHGRAADGPRGGPGGAEQRAPVEVSAVGRRGRGGVPHGHGASGPRRGVHAGLLLQKQPHEPARRAQEDGAGGRRPLPVAGQRHPRAQDCPRSPPSSSPSSSRWGSLRRPEPSAQGQLLPHRPLPSSARATSVENTGPRPSGSGCWRASWPWPSRRRSSAPWSPRQSFQRCAVSCTSHPPHHKVQDAPLEFTEFLHMFRFLS
ncbi:translation initiation factor IF-2 [Fukomys damarensis]|uniref:translation initiation factor IF-2 n=1 Tax=Fukomys damarensis TaxID=885580 RepID=UPI0014557971|nr:translation initiation factor IF-2 [Fukomys damarensis]